MENTRYHPLTKLLIFLAMPVFAWAILSNVYRTFANPISSKQAFREMSVEFAHIEVPKDTSIVEKLDSNKGIRVWIGASYKSNLDVRSIERYYTQALSKNGWMMLGRRESESGFYKYRIEFCKKQYVGSLGFPRELLPTYSFNMTWNKNQPDLCR